MRGKIGQRTVLRVALAATIAAGLGTMAAVPAMADGSETLGPPSIDIATGTGAIAAGTGMYTQPATIDLTVPSDVTIVQVLAYWEGHHTTETEGADDTITLDGQSVTGDLIGGPTLFFAEHWSSAFRADVTGLDLVSTGANSISVADMDFDDVNNGVGLIVVVDDGGPAATIDLVDGNDLAFVDFAPPLDTTVQQTLTFAPAPVERVVDVTLFASSVEGQDFPGERPNVIEVTVGGTSTRHQHLLMSADGDEWDTVHIPVTVPADVGSITLQALSADDGNTGSRPASLAWIAGLVVAPPYVETTTTTTVAETTTTTTTVAETTTTTTSPETTTTTIGPEIEVAAFAPQCIADIPYIAYDIEVVGTDSDTATITFSDVDGNVVQVLDDAPLSGEVIYPGASLEPDWPGWILNDAGFWVPDPSDAILREGLSVLVEVNPTAIASVEYPDATETCANPPSNPPTPTTTAVGVAPPTSVAQVLPPTGARSQVASMLIGAALIGLGGLALFGARRRAPLTNH